MFWVWECGIAVFMRIDCIFQILNNAFIIAKINNVLQFKHSGLDLCCPYKLVLNMPFMNHLSTFRYYCGGPVFFYYCFSESVREFGS